MTSDLVTKYFTDLSEIQIKQIDQLQVLYEHWNSQINVISRKDIAELYERHVLHSLGIAKVASFLPEERVLDVGTGGGFPGIPLAILFPKTNFHLVDSIGKKIKVVNEVASGLGLKNVTSSHTRAEQVGGKFNFVVSRAVTRLADFYPWIKDKFSKRNDNQIANGILYLKGGDLTDEIKESKLKVQSFDLKDYFDEDFFETKKVLYIKA
ncbi:16S rRNA (guanine(527)-N(7))-methyltransferase RsmG [Mucilaginibacter ginkgonis]|uniref:Ribosomal RNA small subunit methyltransferase G n=1 Tax=Mucilaginibacter ginkgonis TaxID=2682091 RepID=A0A6I4I714_9SPHI|nr:16S rRNA (guanine(527)-N(7))-methyltransferase RsmG [Mucilaginibacter ginkgonis]QQL50706.1 16S rRNA (guanine(527)-N(7))-methyltransferase RsmG [Mucilaginibacter ginkgonis]